LDKKTLTIIDTFGFFFRSFYALPPLKSKQGFPTGLLKGFMDLIYSLGKDYHSDYIVFALDSKGDSFRTQIDPNYKANREAPPPDLTKQLPVAIEWIKKMGFHTISMSGYEADDIIASLSSFAKYHDIDVRVVSHDKDLYQLIDDGYVHLFDPQKRVIIDSAKCFEKFGVTPVQFIDYQSLVGDSADNVPGVKGVGAKTAQKLLNAYKTLDGIYGNIDFITPKGVQTKLINDKEKAYLSKKLVTLKQDMFDSIDLSQFHLPSKNPILAIKDELLAHDLYQIINKVQKDGLYYKTDVPDGVELKQIEPEVELRAKYTLLDSDERLLKIVNSIPKDSIVAFDTETNSLDDKSAKIVGFSFAYNNLEAFYAPIAHFYLGVGEQVSFDGAKQAIIKLFEYKIIGQNLKYDLNIIKHNFKLDDLDVYADTMLLAWLANPSLNVGLDSLALRYFDHKMIKFKDTVGKNQTFEDVDIQNAVDYASEDAWMTYLVYHKIIDKLDTTLIDIHNKIELPFMKTLIDIQNRGIKIDIEFFQKLLEKADNTIKTLTSEILELSGIEFNLNSPLQLGRILFEELGLKKGKKTKSGYSTDERVLKSLIDEHEIIPKILEYREIYKLKSTYIKPLLELASKNSDNIIYTSFIQTGTATGRLSSKNPNLQNIPVRTELGKEIRYGFIPRDGYDLISIDYSQIELRLLAHFSEDSALIEAFNSDVDIHYATALKIFGKDLAKQKRAVAKSINFGLLYGMGSKKLADELKITTKEAKSYIDSYFDSFGSVKEYLTSIQNRAKEDGHIKTLLGRKRIFDYSSATPRELASYDRESVNTLFQGSASDLIKLSMIELNKTLNTDEANILLQIHDELIIEAKKSKSDKIANLAKEIMENIYKLKIPLKTSVSIGKSWGELK